MAARVLVSTHSVGLTVAAAKRHALAPVSEFVAAGGVLGPERAMYGGTELLIGPDAWFCLGAFQQLLKHGAEIRETDRGFDIVLTSGRVFELPSGALLPAALVVLYERFVVDEYEELDVSGSVVVDVGAHIGDSAVYFADRGAAHVYAFEPFDELYRTARGVVTKNGLESVVTVVPQGVAARAGEGAGVYDPVLSHAGHGELRGPAPDQSAASSSPAEQFQVTSLPSILKMVGERHPDVPLVVKMDCEGCEVNAFEADGLRQALERVNAVVVEVHRAADSARPQQTLQECGFSVRDIEEKGGMSLLLATR